MCRLDRMDFMIASKTLHHPGGFCKSARQKNDWRQRPDSDLFPALEKSVMETAMKSVGQLEIVLLKQDADAFCDWVRLNWAVEPVCLERPHGRCSVVEIYFDTLARAQTRLLELPLDYAISSAQTMICCQKHWGDFWRHHYHVLDIGKHLRTVPVWEKAPDRKRVNLRIDPGLSFGTGDHFTTRFCLEELERAYEVLKPRSLLDAGTGSGILAIAGAKLGIRDIAAFDNDPDCVRTAAANAALNRLQKNRIRFYSDDVLQPERGCSRPADVVCANILAGILIPAASVIWRWTKHRLILSGIRESEGDQVANVFTTLGAREILRDGDGEWCGIVMQR